MSVARLILPLAFAACLVQPVRCEDPAKPASPAPVKDVPGQDSPSPESSSPESPPKSVDRPAPSKEQIEQWLQDLKHADYAVRDKASEALAKAGAAAVPGLSQAALEPRLESAIRAVRVLRKMYESGSPADFEAAADALEELAAGRSPVASRAELALSSRTVERQQRVVSRIEELGGQVRMGTRFSQLNQNTFGPADDTPQVEQILLGDDWKGGDTSLKLIRRLPPSYRLAVYVTPGSGIGQQALETLQADRPDIEIQHRGSAMLGISCEPIDGQLTIRNVQEGSGAAEAGLMNQDVIKTFEGKPIDNFEVIITTTRERKVGDKLTLEIERDGKLLSKVITLGKWTLKDFKR